MASHVRVASVPVTRAISVRLQAAMEALWLAAAGLVPLIVAPPESVLSEATLSYVHIPKVALLRTIVGLLGILWLLEWAFRPAQASASPKLSLAGRARAWLRESPTRWILVAAWAFLGVYVLATLLSTSMRTSLWGEVPGQDGYSLYNVAAYVVLFLVIATHLKGLSQLYRLFAVVAAAGAFMGVIGILQAYGIDPLGLVGRDSTRVPITAGNPIFAGSMLLMTSMLTLVAASLSAKRWPALKHTLFWSAMLALQFLAMLFTYSRGPWIGLAAALVVFGVLAALTVERALLKRLGLIAAVALAVTVAVAQVPQAAPGASTDGSGQGSGAASQRLFSVRPEVLEGGLTGRVDIWKGSVELATERPWFASNSLSLPWLRQVVGYGPDTFRYVFPLRSPPSQVGTRHSYAHNAFLDLWVEVGFLGLIAFVALLAALFMAGKRLLFDRSRRSSPAFAVTLAGLLALFAGRLIEQMVGVPRAGDTVLFWVALAAFVALPQLVATQPAQGAGGASKTPKPAPRHKPVASARHVWRAPVVVGLVAVLAMFTWVKSVNYAWAAADMASAAEVYKQGDLAKSQELVGDAIALAPDVSFYYQGQSGLYDVQRDAASDVGEKRGWAEQSYLASYKASQIAPLDVTSRIALANAALQLSVLGYAGKADEAISQYQRVIQMMPGYWRQYDRLAAGYINVGKPKQALSALEQSLEATRGVPMARDSAQALYLQGIAHQDLGERQQAIDSFLESLRMDQQSFFAADIQDRLGQLQAAPLAKPAAAAQ